MDHQSWLQKKGRKLWSEGYELPVGKSLEQALDLLRSRFLIFLGFTALVLIVNTGVGAIPYLGFLITSLVLGPAFSAGYFLYCAKLERKEEAGFADFFKGFDFALPLATYTMVYYFILGLAFLPAIWMLYSSGLLDFVMEVLENPADPPPVLPELSGTLLLVILLNTLVLAFISVAYWWTPFFILFHGQGFWEAMEWSRKLVGRQWLLHFFLLMGLLFLGIILGIIVSITLLLPLFGMLFLMTFLLAFNAFFHCVLYVTFSSIVGIDLSETSGEDDLIDHFVG